MSLVFHPPKKCVLFVTLPPVCAGHNIHKYYFETLSSIITIMPVCPRCGTSNLHNPRSLSIHLAQYCTGPTLSIRHVNHWHLNITQSWQMASFIYGHYRPPTSKTFQCSRSQHRFTHHKHSPGNAIHESFIFNTNQFSSVKFKLRWFWWCLLFSRQW